MISPFRRRGGGYLPVSSSGEDGASYSRTTTTGLISWWREIVIAGLCILIGLMSLDRIGSRTISTADTQYRLSRDSIRWQQVHWHSETYSSSDESMQEAINDAWENIIPAHGIVAVDHKWAAEHNLPESMSHPNDATRGVYYIDAYHQLHCLRILQKTLEELAQGRQPTVPVAHSRHCLDGVLQYITCGTSGDTLLYTWGKNTIGDGQLRECIDWESRADWARRHSACYADVGAVPIYQHFNHCETSVADGVHMNHGWKKAAQGRAGKLLHDG